MTLTALNRWKASALRLALSAAIGMSVIALMLAIWYPQPYFTAMGGDILILKIIAARQPDDAQRQAEIIISAMGGGADLANLAELYVPYAQFQPAAAMKARPLADLVKRRPEDAATIRSFVAGSGRAGDTVGFLPMEARNRDMSVVVDARSGDVIGILPVYPW